MQEVIEQDKNIGSGWASDFNLPSEVKYPVVNIVAEPEYCKLTVHYEADPDVVSGKIDEAVAECRKLQVPGFRKGKAPDQVIKVRLKPQINQYVVREMATHAIDDIVFETNIKIIGQPKFSDIAVAHNKFSCNVELVKKPEFELSDMNFEVVKPVIEMDEEAMAEKSLYNLRLRFGETHPYIEGDVVENGDQVTFSFEATIDGEVFDGSVVTGELYTVGSNRWTGFDQNLLGMTAGDVRNFEFRFTDGPLCGKTAKFCVTLHMGTKQNPHPLDEEFYQIMGVQNAEEIINKLRSISKMSIERNQRDGIRAQVAAQIIERNKFEVPKFIVEQEAKQLALQSGFSFSTLSDYDREDFLTKAEKNTRLSFILDSVRENEPDSILNEVEARNVLTAHIQSQGGDPEKVFKNYNYAAMLLSSIKDEFTLQWIADKATIIE
jgi:trigger factor